MNRGNTTLGGDAVRLTISKVVTMCITMAISMLLSRFRTTEEYGTYSEILLVISLFTTLLMLGLPNSINYFLARAETQTEKRHFLSVYYTLSTILSIILGLVLVLSVPLVEAYFHNPGIHAFAYFLGIYPWAHIISASIENILVVYKKTRFLMAYRIIHSLAMLGCVLVIQWLGLGFSAYMKCFVAVNVLFALSVYLICVLLSGGMNISLDPSLVRAVFAFSIPIGLSTVVGTLNTEIDKLLIGYLMSTEQLAIYTNAAKELPVTVVGSSITAVLLPQLTRMLKHGREKSAVRLWSVATELSFVFIALISAGVFTYAEEAMTFLYSAKYLPGVPVFRIYTLNLLLRCTYFGIILNACGHTRKIFYCSLISLVLNVVLNPIFYHLLGVPGPAMATFLAILIIQLLQLHMSCRVTGVAFSEIFPWKSLGKIILINIAFSLAFWWIKSLLPLEQAVGNVAEAVLLGGLWSLAYLAIEKNRILRLWHCLNQKEERIEEGT